MQRLFLFSLFFVASLVATVGLLQARAQSDLEQGQRLAEEGDVTGALARYGAAVAARPDDAEAHVRLGGMQLLDQQYAAAVKSFQRAVSLGGDSAGRAFIGMGMAYLHMGQYGPARAAFEEAKVREPERSGDIDQILIWLAQREGMAADPQTHP